MQYTVLGELKSWARSLVGAMPKVKKKDKKKKFSPRYCRDFVQPLYAFIQMIAYRTVAAPSPLQEPLLSNNHPVIFVSVCNVAGKIFFWSIQMTLLSRC